MFVFCPLKQSGLAFFCDISCILISDSYKLEAIIVRGSQLVRGRLPWQAGGRPLKSVLPQDFYKEFLSHQLPLRRIHTHCWECYPLEQDFECWHWHRSRPRKAAHPTHPKTVRMMILNEETLEDYASPACKQSKPQTWGKAGSIPGYGALQATIPCYRAAYWTMLCLLKYESAQIQGRSVVDDNGTRFTFRNPSGNSLNV